jgi:hypothetical protein
LNRKAREETPRKKWLIMKLDELTNTIIGLAIKIHRQPGPGLLESVYQAANTIWDKKIFGGLGSSPR